MVVNFQTTDSRHQYGMTLVELLVSVAIGSILLLSLASLGKVAMEARQAQQARNELLYQGRFALDRMVDRARATPPSVLTTPAIGTTGQWFAPAGCAGANCRMFCLKSATRQLMETTSSDSTCSGGAVVANYVDTFVASLPGMGPLDRHAGVLAISLSQGGGSLSLQTRVRLGGGAL